VVSLSNIVQERVFMWYLALKWLNGADTDHVKIVILQGQIV